MAREVTLNDQQQKCLLAVKEMMSLHDAPEPSDDAVLDRALMIAAETDHGKLAHELGSDESADEKLKEAGAWPFGKAD